MKFKVQFLKTITLSAFLLTCIFLISSCQKDAFIDSEPTDTETYETSQRMLCNSCPNIIENGDFEDVCNQFKDHFITFGCVGGNWTNVYGTADVRGGNLFGTYSLIQNSNGIIFNSESVVNNTPLAAGIEYCLEFDSYYNGVSSTSNIELWQVCMFATDNHQANTATEAPCSLNDPFFLSVNETMMCYDLQIGDNFWLNHNSTFTLTQDHTQIWPVLLPKFDLTNFNNSYANQLRIDNIYISCESDLFTDIETIPMGDCSFRFTPLSDEVYPGNQIEAHWDFGDGDSSTDLMPIHQYKEEGTYEVTLTYTDHNGCCGTIKTTVVCEPEVTTDEDCIIELCWLDFIGTFECLKEIELIFNDGTPPLTVAVGDIPQNGGYNNLKAALISVLNQSGINYTFTEQHPFGPTFDCYKGGTGLVPGWYIESDVLESFTFWGGDCGKDIDASVSSTDDNCWP